MVTVPIDSVDITTSVTGLGDFLKVLVTNILSKVPEYLVTFWDCLKIITYK